MQSNVAETAILVSGFTIGFKLVTCREFGLVNSNCILVRWFQTNFFFLNTYVFFQSPKKRRNIRSVEWDEKMWSKMMRFCSFPICLSIDDYVLLFSQVCSSFAVTSWTAPRLRSTGSMYSSVGETTTPTTLKDMHAQNTSTTPLTTWVSTPPLLGCSLALT